MHRAGQDEVELEKSVRRLREKFYGKVSILHAVKLMRRFNNNHDLACKYIILCKDEMADLDQQDEQNLSNDTAALNVMNKLTQEEEQEKQKANDKNDEIIKEAAEKLKVLKLTQENLRMFDNAKNNCIPPTVRQFSCQACDSMWWRRVPERKQASRCHKCWKKYDPVLNNKMWGIAEFNCTACGHHFRGFAQMGTPSPCYRCHTCVLPSSIIPPKKTPGPRTKHQHSCCAEDCFNRREPHMPGTHCVHPISRRRNGLPKVIYPSEEHDSTGSTVATCLSQGSLSCFDIDYLILEDLEEQDEGDGGRSSP